MSRRLKIALWSGAGVLAVFLILLTAIFVIPNTDGGRLFITRKVAELSHDRVHLTGIHGSFPADLILDRLELRDTDGLWLWADHLSLQWSPGALLRRQVDVASLKMALLHVERSPVPDPDAKPSKSSSSIPDIDVQSFAIETLELGRALAGNPASFTVRATAHLRSLDDLDAHLKARRLQGNGDYALDAKFDDRAINATLKLQEPAQGPLANLLHVPQVGAIEAVASVRGPRTQENLAIALRAGSLRANVDGRVNLKDDAADLSYAVLAPPMSPSNALHWDRVELAGQLHGPFTSLTATGHLLVRSLEAPGGLRLGAVEAQLKGDQGQLQLQAGIDGLRIPGAAPNLLQDSRLDVDASLRLDDPRRPLVLNAHHRLFDLETRAITADPRTADLQLRLPDLKPFAPYTGTPIRGDAQLTAHVNYAPALTRVMADLNANIHGGNTAWGELVRGGLTRAKISAKLTDQQVELEDLKVTSPGFSLSANGNADREGEQKTTARFDLELPDLHRAAPALEGDLKVAGTIDGPRSRLNADTRLSTHLSVRGSPRGALSAHLQAQGLPAMPQGVLEVAGELDGARLELNGKLKSIENGEYRALIERAAWKSAHASADVSFGSSALARGAANVEVSDLNDFSRLAGLPMAGAVQAKFSMAPQAGRSVAALNVEAHDVVAGGVTANAKVDARGPMDALTVTIDADSPAVAGTAAQLNAGAVLNLSAKELELSSFRASYHGEDLALIHPAKLAFSRGLTVRQLQLGMDKASLELDGQVSPTFDFRASVKNIEPSLVNAFVPNLLATGRANADATIRGSLPALTGVVHVEALNVRALNDQAKGLPATDLRAQARLDGDQANVEARLTAGTESQVALTGRAPLGGEGDLDLKLAGFVNLTLANPMLEAAGRHATGALTIDTAVTGKANAPDIAGTVHLRNGSVRDYVQGLSLTDIAGDFEGDHGVLRIKQLTARAAPGNLNLEGSIGVLQPNIPIDLNLTAKNAQPIASNILTANFDANVRVSGNAHDALDVTGKIHLNRADVTIPGGLPSDVAVLDVDRAGAAPGSPAHPLITNLHLDIAAPNRILIKGRGLDSELGGELHITGTAQAPQVEGGFELQRGFFTLANSKLKFTEGTVTFNGTGLQKKLDPSLDFTAQAKAAEVTAIVHITGLADAPQIELSSTPELPQDEILARLLFGQPAAQLSAVELVETGVALASLRGSSGPSLNPIDRIQKALGLDRLSVSSASNSSSSSSSDQKAGTSVEAGRYVSSRVYVGVKEGTTGASQVDVDVDLTKNLKLQAQLGNGTATAQGVTPENDPGSSLGLAYQFEY